MSTLCRPLQNLAHSFSLAEPQKVQETCCDKRLGEWSYTELLPTGGLELQLSQGDTQRLGWS